MTQPTPDPSVRNTDDLYHLPLEKKTSPQDLPVPPVVRETEINAELATVNEGLATILANLSSLNVPQERPATEPVLPTPLPVTPGTQSVMPVSPSGTTPNASSLSSMIVLVQGALGNIQSSLQEASIGLKQVEASLNPSVTINAATTVSSSQPTAGIPAVQASSVPAIQLAAASSLEAQRLISLFQQPGLLTAEPPVAGTSPVPALQQTPVSFVAASTTQTPLLNLIQAPQGSALDGIQEVVTSIVPAITGIINILGLFI